MQFSVPAPQAPPNLPTANLAGLKRRTRSPPAQAGPSKPRAPIPTRSPLVSSTSSVPSSYVAGYRIPWVPDTRDMAETDDTEDYQPSMTSIKVKHGGKGKGKMVERRRKGERKTRARKPPQSTGVRNSLRAGTSSTLEDDKIIKEMEGTDAIERVTGSNRVCTKSGTGCISGQYIIATSKASITYVSVQLFISE